MKKSIVSAMVLAVVLSGATAFAGDVDRSSDPSKLYQGMTLNPQIAKLAKDFATVQGPVAHDGSFDPGFRYKDMSINDEIVCVAIAVKNAVVAGFHAVTTGDEAWIKKQTRLTTGQ